MAELTIQISDQTECWKCGHNIPIYVGNCPECDVLNVHMNLVEFLKCQHDRQVMDARYGGYVLGRTCKEDDILMLTFLGGNIILVSGFMQGQEYIISAEASAKHHNEIEKINMDRGDPNDLEDIDLSQSGNILDTTLCKPLTGLSEYGGVLTVYGQFIVNRYATKKHFERLQELNRDII